MSTIYSDNIRNRLLYYILIVCIILINVSCVKIYPRPVVKYTDSGDKIKLTQLVKGTDACWFTDSKQFAYVDDGIWITDVENKEEKTQLSATGESPRISPDGNRLVYTDSGIWILDIDTLKKTRLTDKGFMPCWSLDGKHIIYTDTDSAVWSVEIKSKKAKSLLTKAINPACSKINESILVERLNTNNLLFDTWLFDLKKEPKLLLVNAEAPAWSADGEYIMYSAGGIWAADKNGADRKRLTVSGDKPVLSPDGNKLLFSFRQHIWSMDFPYKPE